MEKINGVFTFGTRLLHSIGRASLNEHFSYVCLQQITQHQERFVQMLNEPHPGEAGAAEAPTAPQTNYIQVTPQEKEAIERVR